MCHGQSLEEARHALWKLQQAKARP
jgi:hypothetical protein